VGNLAAGFDADIVVIDLKSQPLIAQGMQRANSLRENGHKAYERLGQQ
jgi:cytosine/adenosine deaminase-related metal-dependent hydrolase